MSKKKFIGRYFDYVSAMKKYDELKKKGYNVILENWMQNNGWIEVYVMEADAE